MADEGSPVDPVTAAEQHWLALRTARGDRDSETLNALLSLSAVRMTAGDADAAIGGATYVLKSCRDILGEHHPDTLTVASMRANWCYHRGDPEAGETLRNLVPALSGVLGTEHETTLWARHTLASSADAVDAPAQRLVTWVDLCGAETRHFGFKHALTLSALFGCAQARRDLNDPLGASIDALAVQTYRETVLGGQHPDTLMAALSKWIWKGEAEGATPRILGELDRLIPKLQDVLGYDNPNTLLARYTRAVWTPNDDEDLERLSEWEALADDLARGRGALDPLTIGAHEKREAARAEWEGHLKEIREIAYDLGIDFEAERLDVELPGDRPWMGTGDLDDDEVAEEIIEEADDFAAEQESEMRDLMLWVIAGKRGFGDAVRSFGNDSEQALLWRYWLAWRLWSAGQFNPAGVRVRSTVTDASRVLGDAHPLTEAARTLAELIEQQYRGGLSAYWEPDITIDD